MSVNLTFPAQGAALVLGGSGGSGSKICETLAKAGTPVAFTYFTGKARAAHTLEALNKIGVRCSAHGIDGSNAAAMDELVEQVVETYGGLHTVVYAGGPLIEFQPLAAATAEQWGRFMAGDAGTVFNLMRAVMPHLRVAKGSFTACVTFANRRVLDYDGLSAVPKAAVESLIRQIAAEEGQHGVRANSVGLGWIDAGVGATSSDSDHSLRATFGDDALEGLRRTIRLGRPGTAQEFANAVVFFASQQASYITGQAIMVDGGGSI